MVKTLSDLWIFLWAVISHTVTLLAGCAATVMLGIIEKYILKRSLSLKASVGIFLGFVFFACFQAWRATYQQANSARTQTTAPVQVTVPITVPPAQIIMGDAAEKAKRKSVRKQLGILLAEGNMIKSTCDPLGNDPSDREAVWQGWNFKVERYLTTNLASDYLARFKVSEGHYGNCWASMEPEMAMLDEFIRDFQ